MNKGDEQVDRIDRKEGRVRTQFTSSFAHWMYGREGQCMDSNASCSTGIVVEMTAAFDGFG